VPVNGQVNVPGQYISVTIPAQNISVTGHTVAATVQVPGQTVPLSVTGTVQPVTVGVGGITSTGTVQTPVLQQFQQVTNVTRSVSIDTKIDELGSARGKIGFTPAPNWLVYGTGGLAFAHVANNVVATESFAADIGNGLQNFSRSVSASGGATLLGWALGAGVDWKLTGTNWILGLEYLHYEFPKHTIGLNDSSASVSFVNNRESVDAVKGRISYLFPIH
jgi:outer membrane immunogenic protein